MTPKWTIRKYPIREDGLRPLFPWFVFPPGVTPPDDHKKAFRAPGEIRATFSEALACVESNIRKDRTVEVELPKVEKNKCIDPSMSPAMFVEKTPGNYGIYLGHRLVLAVTTAELKPLALYLLALHYEKENK